jgi:predicted deacylase
MASWSVRIGGVDTPAGARGYIPLPVTTKLDGSLLTVPVHVVCGTEPGPRFALVSTLHGGEWFSIEILRRAVEAIDPSRLRGALIAIPVGNPEALNHFSRNMPDDSDEPDLNRCWPGGTTWLSEQIARAIAQSVLPVTDYLADYHVGTWGSAMGVVSYGTDGSPDIVARSEAMARAFGYPCIRALHRSSGFPGPRSLGGFAAATLGIPNIGPSIGGPGFGELIEEAWLEENLRGILNVMGHLGMIDHLAPVKGRMFKFQTRGLRVVPSVGGIIFPEAGGRQLLRQVRAGEALARVVSPYSFQEAEVLQSPVDGVLFGICRQYPVRPGDWAFFVADTAAEGSEWIEG